jgi:hypothetical protein
LRGQQSVPADLAETDGMATGPTGTVPTVS